VVFLLGTGMLAAAAWYMAFVVPAAGGGAQWSDGRGGGNGIGRLVAFYDGLVTGHVVTLAGMLGAFFLCLGVSGWAGGRTERLLVAYFDRLDALGQLPPSPPAAGDG
jgi:hypothetical protein